MVPFSLEKLDHGVVMVWATLALLGLVLDGGQPSALAFNRHITEDPTGVLEKYLSLDKKGARLEAQTWPVLQSYVGWEIEPTWGHVVIISKYDIVKDVNEWEILGDLEAKIPVVFDVLGIMHWESVTFVPDSYREKQFFHIKSVGDRWQIVHPQLPPHVGRQRIMDFVKWTAHTEPQPEKKAVFETLRRQLQTLKKKENPR